MHPNHLCGGQAVWLISAAMALLGTTAARAQQRGSLELEVTGRHDHYGAYPSYFLSRSSPNEVSLRGNSYGIGLNYGHRVYKRFSGKVGLGYYRLGISEISRTEPDGATNIDRPINRRDVAVLRLFYTDAYHYDNLTLRLGLTYEQPLTKRFSLLAEGYGYYLYTVKQSYHITVGDAQYVTHDGRTLSCVASLAAGLVARSGSRRLYLSPRFVLPVYQQLRSDPSFDNDTDMGVANWFGGAGLSVAVGAYL